MRSCSTVLRNAPRKEEEEGGRRKKECASKRLRQHAPPHIGWEHTTQAHTPTQHTATQHTAHGHTTHTKHIPPHMIRSFLSSPAPSRTLSRWGTPPLFWRRSCHYTARQHTWYIRSLLWPSLLCTPSPLGTGSCPTAPIIQKCVSTR